MAPKTSILNNKQKLIEAIANSNNSREVLVYLGLRAAGGNYNALKNAAKFFDLELPKYSGSVPTTSINYAPKNCAAPEDYIPRYSNDEVFVENSTYNNRILLKKRMYLMGYKEECSECGLGSIWNGKPIVLQLDHINGIHNDNRLENLRIICPNCHSQTETFAGRGSSKQNLIALRNIKATQLLNGTAPTPAKRIRHKPLCIDCATPVRRNTKRCSPCADTARQNRYNVTYPEIDVLIEQLTATNFVKVAKELGVTDSALRKHVKKFIGESHPLLNKKRKPVII